jgi:hypothetical protein
MRFPVAFRFGTLERPTTYRLELNALIPESLTRKAAESWK